jgi:hypothetical protein
MELVLYTFADVDPGHDARAVRGRAFCAGRSWLAARRRSRRRSSSSTSSSATSALWRRSASSRRSTRRLCGPSSCSAPKSSPPSVGSLRRTDARVPEAQQPSSQKRAVALSVTDQGAQQPCSYLSKDPENFEEGNRRPIWRICRHLLQCLRR